MKNKSLFLALTVSATLLAGCKNGVNGDLVASSGMAAYKLRRLPMLMSNPSLTAHVSRWIVKTSWRAQKANTLSV